MRNAALVVVALVLVQACGSKPRRPSAYEMYRCHQQQAPLFPYRWPLGYEPAYTTHMYDVCTQRHIPTGCIRAIARPVPGMNEQGLPYQPASEWLCPPGLMPPDAQPVKESGG